MVSILNYLQYAPLSENGLQLFWSPLVCKLAVLGSVSEIGVKCKFLIYMTQEDVIGCGNFVKNQINP